MKNIQKRGKEIPAAAAAAPVSGVCCWFHFGAAAWYRERESQVVNPKRLLQVQVHDIVQLRPAAHPGNDPAFFSGQANELDLFFLQAIGLPPLESPISFFKTVLGQAALLLLGQRWAPDTILSFLEAAPASVLCLGSGTVFLF